MFLGLLRNCVRSSFFVFCFVPIYLHVFAFRMQHKVKGDGCHNYQLQGNVNKAVPPSEEAITSGCK